MSTPIASNGGQDFDLTLLENTRRPKAQAITLPGAAYSSTQLFALEQRSLFARQWNCVGRADEVPKPGDFVTRSAAGDSIILLRGQDQQIRAFFNVCRHRGSRLLDAPAGSASPLLVCPYHAWSYDNTGHLCAAPQMSATFRKDDYGLVPVATTLWNGLVFVNLDGRAPPFAAAVTDLPDLARYRMAELQCGRHLEYEVQANWKLLVENYSECYHCPGAHPQLHKLTELVGRNERAVEVGACFNGGPMRLRDGVQTMSGSGRSTMPLIPGLTHEDARYVYYYVVYPNLLLSPHPDYVMMHTLVPVAPGRTRVVCEFLFYPDALALPGFDPADIVDFWHLTNTQDWALCERTQSATASRGFRQGPYSEVEDCVHLFDRWYADQMVSAATGSVRRAGSPA
jgi:Rieske 2Fe-2S family protein